VEGNWTHGDVPEDDDCALTAVRASAKERVVSVSFMLDILVLCYRWGKSWYYLNDRWAGLKDQGTLLLHASSSPPRWPTPRHTRCHSYPQQFSVIKWEGSRPNPDMLGTRR